MRIKTKIAAAPLGREHIRIGFQAIWRMVIQYPLGVTCFTANNSAPESNQNTYRPFYHEWELIAARPTLFDTDRLNMAAWIFFLWAPSRAYNTLKCLSHMCENRIRSARMLSISLDHLQLQAGVSWPVLSRNGATQRQYVDQCYLTHTWEFLDSINAQIRFDPDEWLLPQRQGDLFIMEQLSSLPGLKPSELVHAQRCRLYLGVTTLADIVTSDGKFLCDWVNTGLDVTHSSSYQYPRQDRPSMKIWKTWSDLLRRCFCPRPTQQT